MSLELEDCSADGTTAPTPPPPLTFRAVSTAAAAAAAVTSIAGPAVTLLIWIAVEYGSALLETLGIVHRGWGTAHFLPVLIVAAAPAVVFAALLAFAVYRRALGVERTFDVASMGG